MATSTQVGLTFNVDVNSLLSQLYSAVDNRNDLVTFIENGSGLMLNVTETVPHGNLASVNGANPIAAVAAPPPGTATMTPNTYSIGVEAKGDGSEIDLYITSGSYMWGIILRTVPNGENYFQYAYSSGTIQLGSLTLPVTQSVLLTTAQDSTQYGANQGTQTFSSSDGMTAPGTQVSITMTNVSPATAQIEFYPAT